MNQVTQLSDLKDQTLNYQYDKERNLTALINENGERHQFFYDGNERLIKEIGFDGRTQHYKYNKAGHLIKHMDAAAVVTQFERDPVGQMLTRSSRSLRDKTTPEEITRYRYDGHGRILETYNQHHYLEFTYDPFGQLCREHRSDINGQKQRIKSSMQDILYSNLQSGLRSEIQLPDGHKIGYQYDQALRLQAVTLNGEAITTIERDALGREVARSQGDLLTQSHYDPAGRLQAQQSFHKQQKQAGPIQRSYAYDRHGNLSQLVDGSQETNFVYDLLNRLKRAESSESESFNFDPAGNLLAIDNGTANNVENIAENSAKNISTEGTVTNAGVNTKAGQAQGNRLAFQGDRKFTYDDRGNLVKENRGKSGKLVTYFSYNLQNQLVKVEKDGQNCEYKYAQLGRLTEKTYAFGTTHYLWAGDQMVRESRANIKKTYVYEPQSFKPVVMVENEKVYHYHLDYLGTPKQLTNNQGNVVWQARYRSYGNLAVKEVEEVENNLRFQAQYFDEETGLHYNRHRYYNPNTGMFITQDPIGLLGGINNYQYAPNPVAWVDPFGLKCKENSWNNFQKDTKGHFANSSEASVSYQKMKEVQAMSKGDRPDPATYLPQSYIDTHVQKFANGASRIMSLGDYTEYGLGKPDATQSEFVCTKADIDKIINESNGDVIKVAERLGIPTDQLENGSLVRIDFPKPSELNIAVPSGNEWGANPQWIPGGKLPKGDDEAVISAKNLNKSNHVVTDLKTEKKIT